MIALLAPGTAGAATRILVRGAGYGHGIGMSQYGALGYARHGFDYRSILARYYLHTSLGTVTGGTVRVLLQPGVPAASFRGASRAGARRLRPSTTYQVRRVSGGRLGLYRGSHLVGRFAAPLRVYRPGHSVRLLGRAIDGVTSGRYRGALQFTPAGGAVDVVNALGVDPYAQGVVPGEMPTSWPMEAVKAQAVAARTFALGVLKRGGVFDVYPDTRSQVYRGVAGESARGNAAVRATARQVITYQGRPIVAYFFSTSGGHTENVENVFLGSKPEAYLKGVPDPYEGNAPRHRWRLGFSPGQMKARLGSLVRGSFVTIRVLKRGVSPRIVWARVYGTSGSRRVSGPTLRARLGLYDTWASFYRVSTAQARAGSVVAALLGLPGRKVPELTGIFDPAPRSGRLVVERLRGGRWRSVRSVRTTPAGRYRVWVGKPGVYRVGAGSLAGPAVHVR